MLLRRRPKNNRSYSNLPRTTDLWQDATTYWDYDLCVTDMRLCRVEEVGQGGLRQQRLMGENRS